MGMRRLQASSQIFENYVYFQRRPGSSMVMVMVGVRRRDLETGDGNAGVGEKKRREWTGRHWGQTKIAEADCRDMAAEAPPRNTRPR